MAANTPSNFLERKLARRFRSWDTNGNGAIGRDDFEQAAQRACDAFGYAPDSAERAKLVAKCIALWDGLAAHTDTDRDGKVTEAEYRASFTELMSGPRDEFDATFVPMIDTLVDIADRDGDRKLTLAEFVKVQHAFLGVSEADTRVAFGRLDRDGDGYITHDEFREAVVEYYFSDDPRAPGNLLLGPL